MTLYEHAKKNFLEKAAPPGSTCFIAREYQSPWLEAAYDELAAERDRTAKELDEAKTALRRIHVTLEPEEGCIPPHSHIAKLAVQFIEEHRDKPASADPSIDQIRNERATARVALNLIHTAFRDGACGVFDPHAIAARTVKFIREHLGDPVSDPSIDWPTVLQLAAAIKYPDNKHISLDGVLRDALRFVLTNRPLFNTPPEPPKKAVYEWSHPCSDLSRLRRDGNLVGTVSMPKPSPRRFAWQVHTTVQGGSLLDGYSDSPALAEAAVEAVVRAHFGDEA